MINYIKLNYAIEKIEADARTTTTTAAAGPGSSRYVARQNGVSYL